MPGYLIVQIIVYRTCSLIDGAFGASIPAV